MGAVERLQRRNQDYLLVETIKQVGVTNYSLLARLTGLNPETVRYKVNKHLSKLGLGLLLNVNYAELGLSVGMLSVKGNSAPARSWLDSMNYLVFVGKVMGANKYVCLYAIPFRFKKKYAETIEDLKRQGLAEEYESTDIYWLRYPPFRPELYDFDTSNWKVEWDRVLTPSKEAGASCVSVNRESKVDYIDLKILKAMQEDPTVSLAKTAKDMNVNPRTVRYHYSEHVLKGKFILSNNMRWVKPLQEGRHGELMEVIVSFRTLESEEAEKVRRLFNSLPFTWLEAGTEDKSYFAFMDIPIAAFHQTVAYVEAQLPTLQNKYELIMLDPNKSYPLNLPAEMYEKERGWRLTNYRENFATTPEETR
ncbi:MAG TPA: winged helix-turn-helix domain-containing protein [Nitrososphaerales archaeon]|nr:winged helix-turn-helix domain-containing protein [Nitrososphaerales archaeon]